MSKAMSSSDVIIRGNVVSCTGQQLGNGWRMARARHGFPCSAVPGAVFFEFTLHVSGNARVGWSRMDANVDANVGFCKFSYGYRDVDGSLFHESKGELTERSTFALSYRVSSVGLLVMLFPQKVGRMGYHGPREM